MFAEHKLRRVGRNDPAIRNWTKRGLLTAEVDGSVFQHTDASIGPASADRVVFIAVGWDGPSGSTISSIVIGGEVATIEQAHNSTRVGAAFAWATIPFGTTITIDVNFTGTTWSYYHQVFTFNWSDFEIIDVQATGSSAKPLVVTNQECVEDSLVVCSYGDSSTSYPSPGYVFTWDGIDEAVTEVSTSYGDVSFRVFGVCRVLTTESTIRNMSINRLDGTNGHPQTLTVSFGVI